MDEILRELAFDFLSEETGHFPVSNEQIYPEHCLLTVYRWEVVQWRLE